MNWTRQIKKATKTTATIRQRIIEGNDLILNSANDN